jgi:DNA modification methylase
MTVRPIEGRSVTKSNSNSGKNRLFYGDNLDVLRKSIKDESVDLCYIDPPFNSKRNYFQIYNKKCRECNLILPINANYSVESIRKSL